MLVTPCPHCGQEAKRRWDVTRRALDTHLEHPTVLHVKVSVHYCTPCSRYFRVQPPFLRKGATYAQRVYDKALQSIEADGLPFCRIPTRLARDFHVQPSATTVRRWFRAPLRDAPSTPDPAAFSGVLCVDEVYQRDKAVLLAVDPHGSGPFLATQVIVGDLQPAHLEAFFRQLEAAGIVPRQLVTDESRLYLPVVKKVWPEAQHLTLRETDVLAVGNGIPRRRRQS